MYVIIILSEIKTTKAVFTYCIITEEEGVGLVVTDVNKFFIQISCFSLMWIIFKTMWFFKTTVGSKWVNL